MKKIYTLGLLAALAVIALNACSREDRIIETPVEEQAQGYTLIVNAEKVAATKGLQDPVDKMIKTYWKAGEKVYAYQYDYDAGKWEELSVLTADASETGSTTLRGTLSKVPNQGGFKLYLHSPSVDYSQQYGVLNESTEYSIEDHFDYAIARVTAFDVDETSKTVTATCDGFSSQQAIVKFNFLDSKGNPIPHPATLEIEDQAEGDNKCMWIKIGPKDGKIDQEEHVWDGKVTVDCSGYLAADGIYVALSNVESSSKLHLTLTTAETDTEHYSYTYTYDKTGIRFQNGCYYEINVKMKKAPIDLSQIDAPFTAVDGDVLTGVLSQKYPITIAAGAAIRLKDATIFFDAAADEELTSFDTQRYRFAGLTCEGNADIYVEGHNIVRGFHWYYPGIFVPKGSYIRIYDGDGDDAQELLEVSSNGYAAGIGGGLDPAVRACGEIETYCNINAIGGRHAAAIGSSGALDEPYSTCDDIQINDGEVHAEGGDSAAAIGGGYHASCRDIVVAHYADVYVKRGSPEADYIGHGVEGTCGNVSILNPSYVYKEN